jgi:hypothetical protein
MSSSCTLDSEQTQSTIDQAGYGDSDSMVLRNEDNEYRRAIMEASHEYRDSRKVERFAHEARLQAGNHIRIPGTD